MVKYLAWIDIMFNLDYNVVITYQLLQLHNYIEM